MYAQPNNGMHPTVLACLSSTLRSTQLFTSAIIGDTGPPDNLGEGSVSLNMMLRGVTVPPKNKTETFNLSIEKTQDLVAIIPASRYFERLNPTRKKT